MIATEIVPLKTFFDQKATEATRTVDISLVLTGLPVEIPVQLREVLERHRGDVPISFRLQRHGSEGFRARLMPNRFLWVQPTRALVADLEALLGEGSVKLKR